MMGLDPSPNHRHAETVTAGGWNLRPAVDPITGSMVTAGTGRHESVERFQDCRFAFEIQAPSFDIGVNFWRMRSANARSLQWSA
jgi:hypothetical protein